MPGHIKTIAGVLLALAFIAAAAMLLWMQKPYPVDQDAVEQALQPGNGIDIARENYLVFRPAGPTSRSGLIFYPGGKSEITAYAPVLRRLAGAGLLVVAVPMPLNFPLLGTGLASQVMEDHPDVNRWYLAGHSLGGVAAARYARDHAERLAGLILLASYPDADISAIALDVLSVYASGDLSTTPQEIAQSRPRLPATTLFQEIEGNHWQFGHFSSELNEQVPAAGRGQQQAAITRATLAFTGTEAASTAVD